MDNKILVVEDDASISDLIEIHLRKNHFESLVIDRGDDVLGTLDFYLPDLVILDWMLPGISGLEVLRRIKMNSLYSNIPILMLTAKNLEQNKIDGFENGIDDYLTKPFIPSELIARIKAILKRSKQNNIIEDKIYLNDIVVDQIEKKVFRGQRKVNLGPTEYKILHFLINNKKRVFSRDEILNKVWPYNTNVEARTVDVHIRRLRKELNYPGEKDYIRTVRSSGYSIDNE